MQAVTYILGQFILLSVWWSALYCCKKWSYARGSLIFAGYNCDESLSSLWSRHQGYYSLKFVLHTIGNIISLYVSWDQLTSNSTHAQWRALLAGKHRYHILWTLFKTGNTHMMAGKKKKLRYLCVVREGVWDADVSYSVVDVVHRKISYWFIVTIRQQGL